MLLNRRYSYSNVFQDYSWECSWDENKYRILIRPKNILRFILRLISNVIRIHMFIDIGYIYNPVHDQLLMIAPRSRDQNNNKLRVLQIFY